MSEEPNAVYRQSLKASLGQVVFVGLFMAFWGGIFFGIVAGAILAGMGFQLDNLLVFTVVGVVFGAVMMVLQYLRIRSIKYEIFDDSIRKTYGIVTTNFEEMDASRIDDVEYRESIIDGLFGTGSVSIQATGSDDEFDILHIDDGRAVYERFRQVI